MDLTALLQTSSGQLLLLSVGVFAILAVLIIPSYFIAVQPKRGTIEWMQRIDRPQFSPLTVQPLCWSDIAWVLLSGFCTAMLRLTGYLLKYLRRGWLDVVAQYFDNIMMQHLLPCTVLGVLMYLLLRSIFDQPLPAICGALLCGMMQMENYLGAILTVTSFIFLWRFLAADENQPLLLHSLLLLLSLLFYGIVLLRFWPLIWLAPLYAVAYVYAQVKRWRKSTLPHRGIALAISLLLLFFMAIGAVLCAWLYYCYKNNQMDQILNLQHFWKLMSAKLSRRMELLIRLKNPLLSIYAEDVILLLMGAICFIPILHGLFARRDSFCLVILSLVPFFVAMWLCSGMYLLVPMLILPLTWVFHILLKREYPSLTIGFTVLTVIGFLTEYYI